MANSLPVPLEPEEEILTPPAIPYRSLNMMSGKRFKIKLRLFDSEQKEFHQKEYESNSFGNFNIRLSLEKWDEELSNVQIYELKTLPGLELLLGSFLPTKVKSPKKLVISDFDKTLVDTQYSSFTELLGSLRRPIHYFPAVDKGLEILKQKISENHIPFILSASPHFYEKAIRDWLYGQKIFTNNIFLKDVRSVFSFLEGDLTPKDLTAQGFYKLNQLVDILLMTGIPDVLVLMGDCFESDRLIYLTLASILVGKHDPWSVWNAIKKERSFQLTTKQHFSFLSKFYRLGPLAKAKDEVQLEILIRCRPDSLRAVQQTALDATPVALLEFSHLVTFYEA